VQINFRVPANCQSALRTLAKACGLAIEELGTDAFRLYFGADPLDPARHQFVQRKMTELNLKELCRIV
jgi:hypothetical protein